MDTKKQGFFSALREEVARGLSPARARRRSASNAAEVAAALRVAGGAGEALAPLMEGPDPEAAPGAGGGARREGWGQWVRGKLLASREKEWQKCRSHRNDGKRRSAIQEWQIVKYSVVICYIMY